MAERKFEVVQDDAPPERPNRAANTAAVQTLLLAIKVMSQRAFVALLDSFALIVVALVFWVWMQTPDPNPYQIVSLTLFALFGLAAIAFVRLWR